MFQADNVLAQRKDFKVFRICGNGWCSVETLVFQDRSIAKAQSFGFFLPIFKETLASFGNVLQHCLKRAVWPSRGAKASLFYSSHEIPSCGVEQRDPLPFLKTTSSNRRSPVTDFWGRAEHDPEAGQQCGTAVLMSSNIVCFFFLVFFGFHVCGFLKIPPSANVSLFSWLQRSVARKSYLLYWTMRRFP